MAAEIGTDEWHGAKRVSLEELRAGVEHGNPRPVLESKNRSWKRNADVADVTHA
jgi:hypothetical protein